MFAFVCVLSVSASCRILPDPFVIFNCIGISLLIFRRLHLNDYVFLWKALNHTRALKSPHDFFSCFFRYDHDFNIFSIIFFLFFRSAVFFSSCGATAIFLRNMRFFPFEGCPCFPRVMCFAYLVMYNYRYSFDVCTNSTAAQTTAYFWATFIRAVFSVCVYVFA